MNLAWLAAARAGMIGPFRLTMRVVALVTVRSAFDLVTTLPLGADLRAGSRHLRVATRTLLRGLRAARPGT